MLCRLTDCVEQTFLKRALYKAGHQASFANARVPNNQQLVEAFKVLRRHAAGKSRSVPGECYVFSLVQSRRTYRISMLDECWMRSSSTYCTDRQLAIALYHVYRASELRCCSVPLAAIGSVKNRASNNEARLTFVRSRSHQLPALPYWLFLTYNQKELRVPGRL